MSSPLIGHNRQIDYINKTRSRGRLPHAYLFHGSAHVGKLTIALTFAQSFFCLGVKQDDIRSVCGTCGTCRAIAEYRDPNVIVLDTSHTLVSKKENRKEIPIEDIRELKRILSFAPQGNAMRLAMINEADKMSEEAANAFLKLLEEPGSCTLIILITSSRDLLLPTIISRTQSIGFLTVPEKDMRALMGTLRSAVREEDEELLTLAGGRPGILIQLCNDASYATEERLLFRTIQDAIGNRDMVSALRISEQAFQNQTLREKTIFCIITNLRDALIRPQTDGSSLKIAQAITRIDRIAHLIDTTNVNSRLGMDVMFLECMKLPLNRPIA